MPFVNPDRFIVRRVDPIRWELQHSLLYYGKRQVFRVPAGYVTDFASVPWWVQSFVPRTGVWTLAATLHDYLITDGIKAGMVTSRECDGLFRRVLREEGTGFVKRWLMWAGVRCAAPLNPGRRPSDIVRDLPQLAMCAAPFVAIGWAVTEVVT